MPFCEKVIKQVKVGDEGLELSNLDFKKLVYLFVLQTTLSPNSYYSVNAKHLNIIEDLETFKRYAGGIDVHDNLLLQLAVCKQQLDVKREAPNKNVRGTKSKMVNIKGCALILHFFIVEHIPRFGPDLMVITNPRMLNWGVIPQCKTMKNIQGTFSGASKQVIVNLIPTVNEHHLLLSLEVKQKVTPNKPPWKLSKEGRREGGSGE